MHSPKPWCWREIGGVHHVGEESQGHWASIATTFDYAIRPGEFPEDAALIAASPDLLEACTKAAYVLGEWTGPSTPELREAWEVLCTAIAKAKGKGEK